MTIVLSLILVFRKNMYDGRESTAEQNAFLTNYILLSISIRSH